ncbi:MAG: hypothetical protein ABI068_13180 [Ktedonobacterales bacterium]
MTSTEQVTFDCDTLIVGMGTSGLLAAYALLRAQPGTRVLLVDSGLPLDERLARGDTSANGYGGAGLYLGGRLYVGESTIPVMPPVSVPPEMRPVVAGAAYAQLAREVNDLFDALGATGALQSAPAEPLAQAIEQAHAVGIDYVTSYPSRYLSAPERHAILRGLRERVEAQGGRLLFGAQMSEAQRVDGGFRLALVRNHEQSGSELDHESDTKPDAEPLPQHVRARALLLAPGRYGAEWLMRVAGELGARSLSLAPTVGVRIEVAASGYNPLTDVNPDPRLQMAVEGDALIKTYATCPGGRVAAIMRYGSVVATGIPVLKRDERGTQTTVAILAQPGAEAAQGAWKGGEQIARRLNARADNRLIVQRLGDVRQQRATTVEELATNTIQPSCADAIPGALYDAYPAAYWQAFETFLARLNQLAPGVASDETLLYGPAEERFQHFPTDDGLQTTTLGLFVAGDAPGQSQGIIQAGVAGLLAGEGLARYRAENIRGRGYFSSDR